MIVGVTAERGRGRTFLLAGLTLAISLALAVAASEVVLRVVYRDGGTATLAGPGGREFEYTYLNDQQLRGPMATGPKAPGVQRIMVMGDSITWGQGVRQWEDTYPPLALKTLNAEGRRYDMAVFAYAGKEIDNHLATISQAIANVDPDIVVYQWYNNDVEISKAGRPRNQRAWRAMPWHDALKRWSYLYFVLDFALDARLAPTGRTYVQYLEEDFAPGTPGWSAFTRTFHNWAAHATGYATRTIMLLYPPVPMTALVDLRQRVTALAAGQTLSFAPGDLRHTVGEVVDAADAPGGRALVAKVGTPAGTLAATPGGYLAHGDYVATVDVRLNGTAPTAVATLQVTSGPDGTPVASMPLEGNSGWIKASLPFHIGAKVADNVQIRVAFAGGAEVAVGRVELPVHYGIEVVDLQPPLAAVNTAASLFDAHPNARAHAVMADVLAAQIRRGSAR